MRLILLVCIMIAQATVSQARDPILVFAPSSMTDVLGDAAAEFESQSGFSVILSFAGTQQLARQLDAGAPADMYITADRDWMDWSINRRLVRQEDVFALAGNRLVIAVHGEVENGADPDALLTGKRFAMAEPNSVPAGRYSRQALKSRGIWDKAKKQAVYGDNVRTTLRRLARGEVGSAIVYQSDAAIEPLVKPLFVFPPGSHDPITYWAAATGTDRDEPIRAFLDYLKSASAGQILTNTGFTLPAENGNQ